jgi:hypothetical protein
MLNNGWGREKEGGRKREGGGGYLDFRALHIYTRTEVVPLAFGVSNAINIGKTFVAV